MPGRDKPLITRNGIPDPQAYNPQTGQWESFIGVSWGKTAGGLYVPIRVDDQGRQEVTLSGTIAEDTLDEIRNLAPSEAVIGSWNDTYPTSGSLTLFDTGPGQGAVLDQLVIVSNMSNRPQLRIGVYTPTGISEMRYTNQAGGVHREYRPDFLYNSIGLSDFEVVKHESGSYIFKLARPVSFPYGLRAYFVGASGDPEVTAVWRYMR